MTTHHPLTLHEDSDAKVVQLNGDYSTSWGCSINELKAVFYASGHIELHRFKNDDDGITCFSFSQEEVNAFIAASETFQAEQALKKLAEEKRLAELVSAAYKLLEGLPVTIEDRPETDEAARYWKVRSDVLNVDLVAYTPEQFKARAERAVEEHQRRLNAQRIHDEVKALKESCPAIKIHGSHAPWHVAIPEPDIYGEHAMTPEQLLERVKAAKLTYERWQAEQDLQQQEQSDPIKYND